MNKRKTLIIENVSTGYLCAILEDARITTIQAVEKITTDELHWQYSEGWNTISVLLSHSIALSHYFRVYFIENNKFTAAEKEAYKPGIEMGKYVPELITNQPVSFYIEALQDGHQQLCKAIKSIKEEDLYKKRDGFDKETGCNLAWVLYHTAEDEIHHRGQILLLRKLFKQQQTDKFI